MLGVVELLDVQHVVLSQPGSYVELDHCSFVVVGVAVVGGRENGDD